MKIVRIKEFIILVNTTLLISTLITLAYADLPTEQLKEKIDAIKKILDDPGLKERKAARMEFIMNVVDTMVDWEEATKRALGIHWRKRTAKEKEEFIKLFKDLLKRTYSDKLDLYSGQEIVFDSEKVEDDFALVKSRIIDRKKGENYSLDFRLLKRGNLWLTYDISVEGISILNNYRVQFDEIIANSSYEELVKKMKEKQKKGVQTSTKALSE